MNTMTHVKLQLGLLDFRGAMQTEPNRLRRKKSHEIEKDVTPKSIGYKCLSQFDVFRCKLKYGVSNLFIRPVY